jgi:hypothetical protein
VISTGCGPARCADMNGTTRSSASSESQVRGRPRVATGTEQQLAVRRTLVMADETGWSAVASPPALACVVPQPEGRPANGRCLIPGSPGHTGSRRSRRPPMHAPTGPTSGNHPRGRVLPPRRPPRNGRSVVATTQCCGSSRIPSGARTHFPRPPRNGSTTSQRATG